MIKKGTYQLDNHIAAGETFGRNGHSEELRHAICSIRKFQDAWEFRKQWTIVIVDVPAVGVLVEVVNNCS